MLPLRICPPTPFYVSILCIYVRILYIYVSNLRICVRILYIYVSAYSRMRVLILQAEVVSSRAVGPPKRQRHRRLVSAIRLGLVPCYIGFSG